ncbi:hypothetical protein PQX77_013174 [Marasmius sp. AFHP31]|nr:hypothetical protein PQX77_013174 [Marasmius sp. AFHP31]
MPKCSGYDFLGDDCENEGTKQCAGCKAVYYCSKRCQTSNWEIHIWNCKVPIHTGHFLARACRDDLIPTDPQTCLDYGFERAGQYSSELLGMYQGLWVINPELTVKEVHQWRKNGILADKIKETFYSVPENARGGYFPWFLQNEWVLNENLRIPDERRPEVMLEKMAQAAWERIGEDQSAQFPSWSEEKRECFWHYGMVLTDMHPPPTTDAWVRAGYCVVRDEYEEMQVAKIYQALFKKCTWDEYHTAYESSSVYDLFEKYNVPLALLPRMREAIRVVLSTPHPYSVWHLKRCVLDDNIQPIPAVIVDYGFTNCKAPSERDRLADKYRAVFKAKDFDEIKLHEACMQGKIFEYAKERVSMTKEERKIMKKLMRNPYPLRQG